MREVVEVADSNEAPSSGNTLTLTVCGDRVVNGHVSGETFTVDLGDEGTDERVANDRQIRAWIMGGHVVDPVLSTRKRKRKTKAVD